MDTQFMKKVGLQFFAEGEDANISTDNSGSGNNDTTDPNPSSTPAEKTFTQAEVNKLLANEKRQGRQSALRALGLNPDDKNAEKAAKAILDAQKTQAERDAEALTAAQAAQTAAEQKAQALEHKFSIIAAGCKVEYADEVAALVSLKITDTTDFDTALKAVKEKFSMFFEDTKDNDTGTGKGQGHKRQNTDQKPGGLGARLAQNISSKSNKNPYFND